MIGLFDSGYGGLTIARALFARMPKYSYMYLGDNENVPYGHRSQEEIFQLTKKGVEFLFTQGCQLVVLACNTASAVALRRIQQELVLTHYPGKKVLGIVVPTIEQITGVPWRSVEPIRIALEKEQATVGILATEQTVRSGVYEIEITKRNPNIHVIQQVCDGLVQAIELDNERQVDLCIHRSIYDLYEKLPLHHPKLSTVLLGCTHFELMKEKISNALPEDVVLYGQPSIVAESLREYVQHHPDIKLDQQSQRVFFTTGDAVSAQAYAAKYIGYEAQFSRVMKGW